MKNIMIIILITGVGILISLYLLKGNFKSFKDDKYDDTIKFINGFYNDKKRIAIDQFKEYYTSENKV